MQSPCLHSILSFSARPRFEWRRTAKAERKSSERRIQSGLRDTELGLRPHSVCKRLKACLASAQKLGGAAAGERTLMHLMEKRNAASRRVSACLAIPLAAGRRYVDRRTERSMLGECSCMRENAQGRVYHFISSTVCL